MEELGCPAAGLLKKRSLLLLPLLLCLLFFSLRYACPLPAVAVLRKSFQRPTNGSTDGRELTPTGGVVRGTRDIDRRSGLDEKDVILRGEFEHFRQGGANGTVEAPHFDADGAMGGAPMPTRSDSSDQEATPMAEHCDPYDGDWVVDETYPLYSGHGCPFIDEGFSCEANGRKDTAYMKWRWQPRGCSIPRFDGKRMLEMLRGKRMVFVGDSINRNQWESMMCLLYQAVGDPARVREARGRRITKEKGQYDFKFLDYGSSVEYYVAHFLVHESKARMGRRPVKTLRIDTVHRSVARWRGADILVFNTDHWWSHHKSKAGLNYFQEGDLVYPHLDTSTAFRKALSTWAAWVDSQVNMTKTRVFFRSSAPSHFSGGEWNTGGHCRDAVMPLNGTSGWRAPERNIILDEVVRRMKMPVTVLNITSLSGLRIDGHPSVFRRAPASFGLSDAQDCSHWCLPGVPDAWNELLYHHLMSGEGPAGR